MPRFFGAFSFFPGFRNMDFSLANQEFKEGYYLF
jgi:hypothetical protein